MSTEYRINGIDFLRGIAALAVCWFHLSGHYWVSEGALKASGQFGFLGVDVFFVVSGFVIPYSLYRAGYRLRNYPTFLLKRITRLDPPYIASIVFVLLSTFTIAAVKGQDFQLDKIGLLLLTET